MTILRLIRKEYRNSKRPIGLGLVKVDQIAVSDKFKHSDDGFKYFIGYKEHEIVKALCVILPQMSGYIKCFENKEKTCPSWLKMMKIVNEAIKTIVYLIYLRKILQHKTTENNQLSLS